MKNKGHVHRPILKNEDERLQLPRPQAGERAAEEEDLPRHQDDHHLRPGEAEGIPDGVQEAERGAAEEGQGAAQGGTQEGDQERQVRSQNTSTIAFTF